MPATVVVGGQFGSEGKGKVVALLASTTNAPWVVRCGGPNSRHTCEINGVERVLRQLPSGAGHDNSKLLISAGCVVDEDILISEIELCQLAPERVTIDPRAVLVESADRKSEASLSQSIGSTASGTGAALSRRLLRSQDVRLAKDSERLRQYAQIETVAPLLHNALDDRAHVIVEGTQGFGLSLLHGQHYPHVTARDTTASGFASEVGISPRQVDDIVMVMRTFPIRVGGNSGPLPNEITWEDVRDISGAPSVEPEFTSVTSRLRRVARLDKKLVVMACKYNRPTSVAIMGLDRLNYADREVSDWKDLSELSQRYLRNMAQQMGVTISWIGTGFRTFEALNIAEVKLSEATSVQS